MPALRGHHLICLQFFHGEGYNAEFVRNLRDILRDASDHGIDIVAGPDDVCSKCPYLDHDRCRYDEGADEEIAGMDRKALALLDYSQGIKVEWEKVGQKIPGLFERWYEAYCTGCSWRSACGKDDRYRRLRHPLSGKI